MSDIVKQINDAFESTIATVLPSTYNELSYKLDVSKNSFLGNDKRYGVVPRQALPTDTIIKHYTMEHSFDVLLTHGFKNITKDDGDQRLKTFELYTQMDEILKIAISSKLGLTSIITNIRDALIEEPLYLPGEDVVVLRATLIIQYRQALN